MSTGSKPSDDEESEEKNKKMKGKPVLLGANGQSSDFLILSIIHYA